MELEEEGEFDKLTGDFTDEASQAQFSNTFAELQAYSLRLLELHQNPNQSPSFFTSFFNFLQKSSAQSLQPFFDYVLFPLLLLLDAATECRSKAKEERKMSSKVSDKVAESVVMCLEQLLSKCYLGSVDQMVVLTTKLAKAATLSPSEATEESREGAIKCFGAVFSSLRGCSDNFCSCNQILGFPELLDSNTLQRSFSKASESGECLVAFLQSQDASVAVGYWLSFLLKDADTEAARGHRGSGKLRVEAFLTLRWLVAKVGNADALAYFLPGVVSQFNKVLHVSKTMITGAAGSVEAIDQAIRGLAEYLMIVLQDDVNLSGLDMPKNVISGYDPNNNKSSSFLEELRRLRIKPEGQNTIVEEDNDGELVNMITPKSEFKELSTDSMKRKGSLHVARTKDWIEETSAHVNKLLCATFPHICVHPAKKVRKGLLAAIRGLLSNCSYTLKDSRLMLLECLCVMVVGDDEEISVAAQEFLECLFLYSGKHCVKFDVSDIFGRLIEMLPKVVLGSDESLALSQAQKLLVIIYYSGPQFMLDQLQSPVSAARFLDVFTICLGQNSAFTGSLDKLILARPSSTGFLHSIAELQAGAHLTDYGQTFIGSVPSGISKLTAIQEKPIQCPWETIRKTYEFPCTPPWFVTVGSQKLYQALAGTLRLVGLSLVPDFESEGQLSVITDIPLGHLRRLVSEVRVREYNKETWQSWYNRTGSGHLLRQASTAACIINEMLFGLSDEAFDTFTKIFQKSKTVREEARQSGAEFTDGQQYKFGESTWKTKLKKAVIIDGIGIFAVCLGKDFASSGFLHLSLYLLLENLISSNSQVRSASDAVLHVLSATSGYPTVGHLVLANADYVTDSICRQLRHLDLNPHVPNVLAAMLSYIGVAYKILPLLEEPMRSVSQELQILGRHQHPDLNISFLKAVAEIMKASKHEADSLPSQAESYLMRIKSKISEQGSGSCYDNDTGEWESLLYNLNDCKRYRRTVGSIAGSCLTTAIPLLASEKQAAGLVALDIVENGIVTIAKVEEAYRHEKETKEEIEEVVRSSSMYHLQDNLDTAEDGADENRLLPAMNKLWPFLVICIQSNNPVAVRRCLSVISNVVQICGGDFFSRRFHADGPHFWKLLSTSPFQKKHKLKEAKAPLLLPYRNTSISSDDSLAEVSNMKVQVAVLNMIADLSRNEKSASALEVVLKKVSGLVVGIACSGVVGLRDASINALSGLASIDPDLIWLLLVDVYYSLKKRNLPSRPTSDFPEISEILPPCLSPKEYLYVQYGGQSYGFDVDFSSVDTVFRKLHAQIFSFQMYS
ncbi:hypothetical protein WN944_025126 [Citrus x changshan-huyou]|uniref:ARM repeat superfamily protein n=1 Tax=Citrus x changshan-huyou TaxID=2935761 RepID=A0AAP0QD89_9ROSI